MKACEKEEAACRVGSFIRSELPRRRDTEKVDPISVISRFALMRGQHSELVARGMLLVGERKKSQAIFFVER